MGPQREHHRARSAGGPRPVRASSADRTSSIVCQGRIAQIHSWKGGRKGVCVSEYPDLSGGARSQMGWNSKPLRNSNGLELQATTKINGLEHQATAKSKWDGAPTVSKPLQKSNGLELQAMAKFNWVGTPSHHKYQWVGTPSHLNINWVGTPSHGEIQMGWNSKPPKILMGWNSKPLKY